MMRVILRRLAQLPLILLVIFVLRDNLRELI